MHSAYNQQGQGTMTDVIAAWLRPILAQRQQDTLE